MSVTILQGDCRDVLRTLPDESVHCVVTSPPYWGLRDYGVASSVWGGEPVCDHDFSVENLDRSRRSPGSQNGSLTGDGRYQATACRFEIKSKFCAKCGAWLGAFGLEPTYQLYVNHAVEIFREVWRILRRDGTLWLNLGDSYATGAGKVGDHPGGGEQGSRWAGRPAPGTTSRAGRGSKRGTNSKRSAMGKHAYVTSGIAIGPGSQPNRMPQPGLKPKDLCGIPWRVALALQADGWWLRQDIIWSKPNPMPESIVDRCTKAHEYLFHLSKNGDGALLWHHDDGRWTWSEPAPDYVWRHRKSGEERTAAQEGEEWARVNLWAGFDYYFDQEAILEEATSASEIKWADNQGGIHSGEAHVGTRTKVFRVRSSGNKKRKDRPGAPPGTGKHQSGSVPWEGNIRRNKRSVWTVSTTPFAEAHFATFPPKLIEPCILACCPEGSTVLDPFGGAGTTGLVADRLGRNAILVELNPDYAAMAERRIKGDSPLFADVQRPSQLKAAE